MERVTDRIQHFFETYAFGVCTQLGEKLGVATSSIRFILYLCLVHNIRVTRHHLSLFGVYNEHAKAFPSTCYLGLLVTKNFNAINLLEPCLGPGTLYPCRLPH